MSSELGLDPSDPLNLLLHNSSDPDPDSQDNIQAWSSLSSLWSDPTESAKSYADMMPMDFPDLSSSMPMDMDFNHSMAIEPSALHYDPMKFAHGLGMNFAGYDDQYGLSSDLMAAQFPFTFQFNNNNGEVTSSGSSASSISDSPQSFTKKRSLSVTSSSSSSGASLSPVPESLPSPATGGYASDTQPKEEPIPTTEVPSNPYANDPAAELAARVRQAAGVMLAVPMNAQLQGYGQVLPNSKLPIPRLPRHNSTASKSTTSTSSSAASTPPPSTPPLSSAIVAPLKLAINPQPIPMPPSADPYTPVAPTPSSAASTNNARPKTSHTTIERRYRTNLNARIQSLRMAVPALRVLEDRDGGNGKKIKKNLKGNVIVKGANGNVNADPSLELEDGTPIDVIDERGFVDGVKVARKCSKANVLGKAVEYIRVLKKREVRLKKEQEGLKKLIEGLVGGAALVKEWEKEWHESFGGEEKDEVEGEDMEGEGDEDEDDDGDDDDDEDERKRKRAKTSAVPSKKAAEKKKVNTAVPPVVASSPNPLMQQQQQAEAAAPGNMAPEKRKRGRPRKIVPPPVPIAPASAPAAVQQSDAMVQDEPTTIDQQWIQQVQAQGGQQQQPQQYLLAVFALFSFFNSPLTSSSSSSFFTSSQAHTHAHTHRGTVLSAQPPLAYAPEIISQFTPPPAANSTQLTSGAGWTWQEYIQLFHLFVSVVVLAGLVASWLGVNLGLMKAKRVVVGKRGRSLSVRAFRARTEKDKDRGKSRKEGEPMGWMGLGAESLLEGRTSSLSLYDRFQIYRASTSASSSSSSASNLTTLSLILHTTPGPSSLLSSLAKMRAQSVWEDAKNVACSPSSKVAPSVAESLVFEEVKGVEEALEMLARARALLVSAETQEGAELKTPLGVLAHLVVKDRVKRHLGRLFVRGVAANDNLISTEQGEDQRQKESEEEERSWRRTIDAARELGGRVEELGRIFERVWKAPSGGVDEEELEELLDGQLESDNADNNAEDRGVNATVDAEIRALLVALVLYRRLFVSHSHPHHSVTQEDEEGCTTPTAMAMSILSSSSLLSPPPSPRSTPRPKQAKFTIETEADQDQDAEEYEDEEDEEDEEAKSAAAAKKRMLFVLRTALGSRVFEQSEEGEEGKEGRGLEVELTLLEDAKDRVVDLIVDVERREKRGSVGAV